MNKEQQQLLDEAYENYCKSYPDVEKTFYLTHNFLLFCLCMLL